MKTFIKIIPFKLIFNKILRKLLVNFDCNRGAEPLGRQNCQEMGFFDGGMAAPVSMKKR